MSLSIRWCHLVWLSSLFAHNSCYCSILHDIVSTVLKICSSEGRKKGFCTCSSHLGVVSLLYGTASFVCLTPPNNPELRKVASVCYILFTPMLNPLLYSLRNKDVKDAMRKVIWKKKVLL